MKSLSLLLAVPVFVSALFVGGALHGSSAGGLNTWGNNHNNNNSFNFLSLQQTSFQKDTSFDFSKSFSSDQSSFFNQQNNNKKSNSSITIANENKVTSNTQLHFQQDVSFQNKNLVKISVNNNGWSN